MKTVLGLSMTAAGVGWVLVDGAAPDTAPLDDDRFTIRDLDELLPRCVAAVRGAVNGLLDEIIAEHLEAHVSRPGLSDDERTEGAEELLAVIRDVAMRELKGWI